MSSKASVEYSATVSPEEAAGYLENLARGIREGHAVVESGDKSLEFEFAPKVLLKLEGDMDVEKGKNSLQMKISWRVTKQPEYQPSLRIVAGSASPSAEE